LVEEMQTLHLAIRDIAQMILNEDSIYADTNAPQVLDCPGAGECRRSRSRSPRYGSSPSPMRFSRAGAYGRTRSPPPPGGHSEGDVGSCYWGDSTLSTVYAALNRRSMQIAEASAKLQSAYSKLEEKDKQTADYELERQALQNDILRLREEYSQLNQEKEKHQREVDGLRKSLDAIMQEKQRLERAKASLAETANTLEADLNQAVAVKQELLDKKESLLSDLREARRDTERNARETERCKKCISSLEERLATCKEELAGANESLRLIRMEVESSRLEREELMKAAEKSARELMEAQTEIAKTRAELSDLSERFMDERNKTEELLTKRSELVSQLKALEAEVSGLLEDRHNLEKDRDGFRREVIRLQSEKNDLQGERTALKRALEMSEKTRQATETELSQLSKANLGLNEQARFCPSQKNSLSQEMNHQQRETDRLRDALARVTREHAEVVREKGDLQAQVVTSERSLRQQADYITALGQDKSQIERDLQECRQELSAHRQRQEALDYELTEKERKLKLFTSDLTKLRADLQKQELQTTQTKEQLTLQLQEREAELRKALQTNREEAEREIADLRRSIIDARKEGERRLEEANHTHAAEMDAQRQEFRAEREKLQVSVMGLQRERDELMLFMEGEKQKLITQADQERNLLIERISDLEKHAQEVGTALADAKLEAKVQQQREETTVKDLRKDLEETRKQFSEERNNLETAIDATRHDLAEMKAKREQSVQLVTDLTAKLKALEETKEEQRNEMSSLRDRISEVIDQRDNLRQEFMETKKSLVDCQRERDSALETQRTLQIKLKELQAENLEINRNLQGCRQRCSDEDCVDFTVLDVAVGRPGSL
uniref:Myosin_tail_1 domain-containing protein n=1 Tax=Schistocephalus solidus TaxID=70667 RepID=A0A183T4V7_SCHSO